VSVIESEEDRMKNIILAGALILACATVPALAQSKAPPSPAGMAKTQVDCQANWKAADKSNDGYLDKSEIDASKVLIPTTLASSGTISMQDFLIACSATVKGQQQ
jgi:hypothetical protein